jgi:integrase
VNDVHGRERTQARRFSIEEMGAILGQLEGQVLNFYQFAFWTGLGTSELIALQWGDVEEASGVVRVRRAKVMGAIKTTKTAAGRRDVRLLPPALDALKRQKTHTQLPGGEIFHNPLTGRPWVSDKAVREVHWRHALTRGGIRYRVPYQTRHTYASMMLTAGEDPMWVAQQMGHRSPTTTYRKYARWIPENRPDAGAKAARLWSQGGHKGKVRR